MSKNNGDKYVNWTIFMWAIGILVTALGVILSIIIVVKVDIGVVKNEIEHINEGMEEIKDTLTANIGQLVPEEPVADIVNLPEDAVQELFPFTYDQNDPHYEPPAPPLAQIIEPEPIQENSINRTLLDSTLKILKELNLSTTTANDSK